MRGGLSLDSSAASTCRCPYCGALIHVDDEDLEYERRRRADTESKLRELNAESALRLKELRSATAEKLKANIIEHSGQWFVALFGILVLIGMCVALVVWSNIESIQSKQDNAA